MARSSANGSFHTRGVNVMVVAFMCFMVVTPNGPALQAEAKGSPTSVNVFVHEKRTLPDPTTITVAPAPLTSTHFGSVIVFDNEVRETASADSTLIGRELGLIVVGIDNTTLFGTFTFQLNTTEYAGSLTLSGIIQTGRLVVTGGTDSFNLARGVANVQLLVNSATAGLFYYSLELDYCY